MELRTRLPAAHMEPSPPPCWSAKPEKLGTLFSPPLLVKAEVLYYPSQMLVQFIFENLANGTPTTTEGKLSLPTQPKIRIFEVWILSGTKE